MYKKFQKCTSTTRLLTFGFQYFQLHSLASWCCVNGGGGGGGGYGKIPNVCFKRLNSLLVPGAPKCSSSSSLPLIQMHTKRFKTTLILIYRNDDSFYMDFPGKGKAILTYEEKPDFNVFIINHTYVPYELKGTGVGKKLAEVALKYASDNNYYVRVRCGFVQNYIKKYEPKYKELLI